MGVVTEGIKHSMNPFDEIALEEVYTSIFISPGSISFLGCSYEREKNSVRDSSSQLRSSGMSGY